MPQIIIKNSIAKLLPYFVGSLFFTLIGILIMLVGNEHSAWSYLGVIVLFGGCTLLFGWKLFNRRPQIVLTPEHLEIGFLLAYRTREHGKTQTIRSSRHIFSWQDLDMDDKQYASITQLTYNPAGIRNNIAFPHKLLERSKRLREWLYILVHAPNNAARSDLIRQIKQQYKL